MAALSCFPLRPTARSRIGAGGVRHWRPARTWARLHPGGTVRHGGERRRRVDGPSAYNLGLNLTIVLDAISDFNPVAKAACEANIYPMLPETASLLAIIKVLNRISRA